MQITERHTHISTRQNRADTWSAPERLESPAAAWFHLQGQPIGAQAMFHHAAGRDIATLTAAGWTAGDVLVPVTAGTTPAQQLQAVQELRLEADTADLEGRHDIRDALAGALARYGNTDARQAALRQAYDAARRTQAAQHTADTLARVMHALAGVQASAEAEAAALAAAMRAPEVAQASTDAAYYLAHLVDLLNAGAYQAQEAGQAGQAATLAGAVPLAALALAEAEEINAGSLVCAAGLQTIHQATRAALAALKAAGQPGADTLADTLADDLAAPLAALAVYS